MQTKIRLVTNVGKSQISDDGEFFKLKNIPVTVDGAVMNGLLYRAEDNSAGMPSIVNRVMTLGHPKNGAGEHVSASEGEALVNQFSGGTVERTYLRNGVHYVDAKIRKSTLKAQPEGEWFHNQLEQRKPVGVSTGLFSNREMQEGVNNAGEKYYAIAANQRYDHLALLHESEPPAGGKDTFISFNAEQSEYIINVDEFISSDEETLVKRLFNKLLPMFGNDDETRYNQGDSDNATNLNTNEDDAHMRDFLIQQLTAKGLSVNAEMTDEQLQAELTKALAANAEAPKDDSAVLEAVNSLAATVKAMQANMDAMKDEKMSAEEEDKAKKAKAVAANSKLGLSEDEAKLLPNALLEKFYAQSAPISGNSYGGAPQGNAAQDEVF